ncbi:MAG: signal recognition particle-docking protein FtsY [Verrucomicrobia bacterium]|nr:signal recognition particle-docking protein FtsY [Verrucomicrobiota bacterium]
MAFGFLKSIVEKFTGRPVNWEELEEALIRADLGVPLVLKIVDILQTRERAGQRVTERDIAEVTRNEIMALLPPASLPIRPLPDRPRVILIVGVNGTGKTTSTAKLAGFFKRNRHSVLLAAADTFRAAAIEQLGVWAERLGVEMIRGQYNADPAALCYDAYTAAAKTNTEFLLCDTAGRLHNRANLMAELGKIMRILARHDEKAPHEKLLVVDATTGSNAVAQAREFHAAIGLTGLIVTKLDGSGKGGVLVAIQNELGIPTRFIGTGEKLEDFAPFDRQTFAERVL